MALQVTQLYSPTSLLPTMFSVHPSEAAHRSVAPMPRRPSTISPAPCSAAASRMASATAAQPLAPRLASLCMTSHGLLGAL